MPNNLSESARADAPLRSAILKAITSMAHEIDKDRVTLFRSLDDGTALSQLADAMVASMQDVAAPVLYGSPDQVEHHADFEEGEHGRYLPVRKTSAGKFTMPLYALPQAAPTPTPAVAWRSRMGAADTWAPCSKEHHDWVLSAPEKWPGYEVQALAVAGPVETFQSRVQPWLMACFGEMIAGDREERNHRFLEESLELVQACGCTASEAHQLVDYVYGRPVGEPAQEVGGVMVTLAALCLANGMNMHDAGEVELARILTKVEKIRAKQAAKPKHSPLPAAAPPAPEIGEALHEAVATIYFDDSSKFRSALGCVVQSLDHRIAGKLLCHPKAAYDESLARRDAARAGPDAPAAARVAIQLVGHWDMHGIQPVHWVAGILRGTFPDGAPLYAGNFTADQRKDLLAAALHIAARDDETAVLNEPDAERIVGLLSDLAGMAMNTERGGP